MKKYLKSKAKKPWFGILTIVSLFLLTSCENRYEDFNSILNELPFEKENRVGISQSSIIKNRQVQPIFNLLQQQLVARDFDMNETSLYPEVGYVDKTLYVLVTEVISSTMSGFHLFSIDLITYDATYIMELDPISNEHYPRLFTDSGFILIYRNDTHSLTRINHLDTSDVLTKSFVSISGHYQVITGEGIFYRYNAISETYVYDAYNFVLDTISTATFRSSREVDPSLRIKHGDDRYQLLVNNEQFVVSKNSETFLETSFIDFIESSPRGRTIIELLDERDLNRQPRYIDVSSDGQRYYIGIKFTQGFLFNVSFFGETPFMIFEWDVIQEEVSYVGLSQYGYEHVIDIS